MITLTMTNNEIMNEHQKDVRDIDDYVYKIVLDNEKKINRYFKDNPHKKILVFKTRTLKLRGISYRIAIRKYKSKKITDYSYVVYMITIDPISEKKLVVFFQLKTELSKGGMPIFYTKHFFERFKERLLGENWKDRSLDDVIDEFFRRNEIIATTLLPKPVTKSKNDKLILSNVLGKCEDGFCIGVIDLNRRHKFNTFITPDQVFESQEYFKDGNSLDNIFKYCKNRFANKEDYPIEEYYNLIEDMKKEYGIGERIVKIIEIEEKDGED